jgi:uncharacterized protein (TIGR02271 family)
MEVWAMDREMQITEGLAVYGSGNRKLGTVEKLHGNGFHVNGQHYGRDQVSRVTQEGVYLSDGVADRNTSGAQSNFGAAQDDEIRVPVAEERLNVGTREVDRGEVNVRKTVETEEQTVPVTLTHEEVLVREEQTGERRASGDDLFQEETIRVPVRGEEAVVDKEAVVTGEMVIEKDAVAEEQQVSGTVRKQRVDVDKGYQEARGGFEQEFNTRRTAATDDWGRNRTFEQAEPHYRAGYSAAHDERYANREFEDAEPELRRDYEMNIVNQNYKTVGNRGGMETSGQTTSGETLDTGATGTGTRAASGGATMPADYAGDSDAVIGGGTAGPRGTAMSSQTARTGDVRDTSSNGGDAWEQLREEVRQGWNRARNR